VRRNFKLIVSSKEKKERSQRLNGALEKRSLIQTRLLTPAPKIGNWGEFLQAGKE